MEPVGGTQGRTRTPSPVPPPKSSESLLQPSAFLQMKETQAQGSPHSCFVARVHEMCYVTPGCRYMASGSQCCLGNQHSCTHDRVLRRGLGTLPLPAPSGQHWNRPCVTSRGWSRVPASCLTALPSAVTEEKSHRAQPPSERPEDGGVWGLRTCRLVWCWCDF